MNSCQSCRNTQTKSINELDCGHFSCDDCLSKVNKNQTVTCQRRRKGNNATCGEETLIKAIVKHTVRAPGNYSGVDPDVRKYAIEMETRKAFDPILRKRPRLSHGQEYEENPGAATSCKSNTGGEPAYEKKRDKKSSDPEIKQTMIKLNEIAKECKSIRGFYRDRKAGLIVLNVAFGTEQDVKGVVEKNLQPKWIERLAFVEQSNNITPLVITGSKIVNRNKLAWNPIGQHPDLLIGDRENIGTISCLGIDERGQHYILTSRHIFGLNNLQQEQGEFVSCFHNRLDRVSDFYYGIMGSVDIPGELPQAVDIAALPLNDTIQQSLNPNLVYDLNRPFDGCLEDLYNTGKPVYKAGALSSVTCGRIIEPEYIITNEELGPGASLSGECFLIESVDKNHRFAEEGDSGALIWDKDEQPIGLVAWQTRMLFQGETKLVTFGVRLDYCLRALDNLGHTMQKCRVVGSPIPVIQRPGEEMYAEGAAGL